MRDGTVSTLHICLNIFMHLSSCFSVTDFMFISFSILSMLVNLISGATEKDFTKWYIPSQKEGRIISSHQKTVYSYKIGHLCERRKSHHVIENGSKNTLSGFHHSTQSSFVGLISLFDGKSTFVGYLKSSL